MPRRSGHAPGHVRDTFLSAIEAYMTWESTEPEPNVEFEVNYVPRDISISDACGLVWNCTDILPGDYARWLEDAGLQLGRQTYAAAAQAMLASIKKEAAA